VQYAAHPEYALLYVIEDAGVDEGKKQPPQKNDLSHG
jgi:hypothetical protein